MSSTQCHQCGHEDSAHDKREKCNTWGCKCKRFRSQAEWRKRNDDLIAKVKAELSGEPKSRKSIANEARV